MQKNWKFKTGIFLIILSIFLFISLLVIPFIDFDGKTKITISTILLVFGEITFWTGGILLGKELFTKYKSYFNPFNWFKKKTTSGIAEISQTENLESNKTIHGD